MEQADADIIAELRGAGLIGEGDVVLEPLTGGVSCDVWKVETPTGPIVVKRPLAQLRVAAEWLAPVERGTSEVRWLRRARGVDARLAPEVLAELPTGHAFAMRFLPGCPVWKDELVAGRVDAGFAAAVGSGIAAVHAATAHNDADRDAFPNDDMFRALRIDPFLLYVAENDAELAPHLRALAVRQRVCRCRQSLSIGRDLKVDSEGLQLIKDGVYGHQNASFGLVAGLVDSSEDAPKVPKMPCFESWAPWASSRASSGSAKLPRFQDSVF